MLGEREDQLLDDARTIKEGARAAKGSDAPATDAGVTMPGAPARPADVERKAKPSAWRSFGRYLRNDPKFTVCAFMVLSVFFGVVAGYVSGWTDEILSLSGGPARARGEGACADAGSTVSRRR